MIVILIALLIIIGLYFVGLWRQQGMIDKIQEDSEIRAKALRALNDCYTEQEKELFKLKKTLEEHGKAIADIPVEDLRAKYDAEKAWNEGVQNIMNYGIEKLNKDGAANE